MSPANRPHPGRALGVAVIVLAALYGGMVLSGRSAPALGLDLRGGTTVTLTPSATNAKIDKSALNQSVDIIRERVDGLGVSSAEVTTEGNNIVIAVPGKGREDVLDLVGKTALLDFRPVTETAPVTTVRRRPLARSQRERVRPQARQPARRLPHRQRRARRR